MSRASMQFRPRLSATRTKTRHDALTTTATDTTSAKARVGNRSPSVPASNACAVTHANTTKLDRCNACQARRGSRSMSIDVTWIAASR